MKNLNLKTIRLNTSKQVSTTYSIMLQLYTLNKRRALEKKEVKLVNGHKDVARRLIA